MKTIKELKEKNKKTPLISNANKTVSNGFGNLFETTPHKRDASPIIAIKTIIPRPQTAVPRYSSYLNGKSFIIKSSS